MSTLGRCVSLAIVIACLCPTISAQTAAMQQVGFGYGMYNPTFTSGKPVIGTDTLLGAVGLQPSNPCYICLSNEFDLPYSLGFGATVYVDINSFTPFGPVMTDSFGSFVLPMSINVPPSVAGSRLMLQVYATTAADTKDVFGFELSNGVRWVLGL